MATNTKIIGQLVVVAYKARYLPEREIVGKQDPFVLFRIGETLERTKTDIRGGQHPVWDDQVTLPIPEKKTSVLVQVFDEDGKRQELISELELDITNVLKEGEEDNWYQLKYKGRDAGEIYLELTFYAAQPPPKRQPTRFGVGKTHKPYQGGYTQSVPPTPHTQGGYAPSVPPTPHTQSGYAPTVPPTPQTQYGSNFQYQSQPRPNGVRPPMMETSQSAPTHFGTPQPQQRPAYYNGGIAGPNPTPSISATKTNPYPPTTSQSYRPYGQQPPLNTSRPNSPPIPQPNSFSSASQHAPLLSSSYNPSQTGFQGGNNGGYRPNQGFNSSGYPPSSNHGYPSGGYPSNNRPGYPPNSNGSTGYPSQGGYPPSSGNGYPPNQNNSGYPQNNNRNSLGFPEPQHFPGGYSPHADNLGTPFAAHQGAYPSPYINNAAYPPQQGYPPATNNNQYPPY